MALIMNNFGGTSELENALVQASYSVKTFNVPAIKYGVINIAQRQVGGSAATNIQNATITFSNGGTATFIPDSCASTGTGNGAEYQTGIGSFKIENVGAGTITITVPSSEAGAINILY